ncbi:MAG TPA: acyl-CoA ligase (AMP-forming), exosortase A system-associated [Novosphingobium sp.]|nr:acyl-CoA ligase (AMP-forming), exosortase A system-associated [Novosphingobium sp.]
MILDPIPPALPLDHLALRGEPDAPALWLRERTLSYNDLSIRVAALAGWLSARVSEPGAETGQRVACWMAKTELACLLPLAAARAGLVYVPINPLLKRAQVAHILADSGARLLIANEARLATLESADLAEAEAVEAGDAAGDAKPLPPSQADPASLAQILYTSGSTGRPKGVVLSHANLWLGAVSVARYLKLEPEDRVLAALPLSFDYGQSQLLSTWHAGASAAPLDYLTPRDVVKAVARLGITTLAAVPPLWVQLAEHDWPAGAGASLRRLTNTGGALTPGLVRRLRDMFPQAELFAMFGLTEAFRSTYLDPTLVDAHPTSVGRAIPFAEVMVVADDGTEAAADEEGELVHAGPLVAQGYWRDAARTAERFRPAPAWSQYGGTAVWSGDRVRRDRDGLLHFVGRRDAMIKTSGNRVSPQEIEDAALATGWVAEAVAVGVPDARLGQAIHLFVRPKDSRVRVEDIPLAAALGRDLPNFMLPQAIHWHPNLPRNPNGKLDRAALAAEVSA